MLNFAREVIAMRKASPALTLGGIAFARMDGPLVAFVREYEDEAIACVFNFSGEPQVFDHPTLSVADLLPLRNGEAELRGDSVGLSPYAACFLRLGQD